ncbi:MAG: thiamine phosphate synthase [Ghiorsea sp.]|nr:thiamine phosphate synthase [Ghiorsea sp.]
MSIFPPIKLLLLTDSKRFDSPDVMLSCIEQAIQGGVDTVVLREKDLDSAKLLSLASKLRVTTKHHGTRLMIHSQADVAKAVGADGVHVDAKSISEISQIKSWLGNGFMLSASCHAADELKQAAQQGADFCFLSPVFPTQSHPGAPSLGAKKFFDIAATVNIPVLALGGIEADVMPLLQGHGVATMGSILNAQNPKKAAQHLLESAFP